jgi:quercetin dioxygenase-like cupin family protein
MELLRTPSHGDTLDATMTMYPSRLRVLEGPSNEGSATSTVYGFVVRGSLIAKVDGFAVTADAGSFFCIPGEVELHVKGLTVVIERLGFRGILTAGQMERTGRLAYIDGCSDSILVMPPRLGDPVLNHLHFPAGIEQTQHRHPSVRLGVVARGRGTAYGTTAGKTWEQPLEPGSVFQLLAHETHAFRTLGGESMDVIAYHPDSDWGPTDGTHPMLNRTYLAR